MGAGVLETPVGLIHVISRDGAVIRVGWGDTAPDPAPEIARALEQLEAYFSGDLTEFDLPLHVDGTAFQQQVCDAMLDIPFGETRTYGDLACLLGAPAQAIGGACGGNPIPIIIPCHRILGAQSLGGYSGTGGIETKVWLLKHEGAGGLLI